MNNTQVVTKEKRKGQTILEGKQIYKFFKVGTGIVEVLKGIDITIKEGEFIILFGSSGCGKSTLLNTLLGLEIPSEGEVVFMGKSLYSYDEDGRSDIRKSGVGLIYQQQNWIKSLNVLENVAFPLTLRGVLKEEREERAMELLKMVSMEDAATQAPTELSSGQQQKVSFARALITNPVLVVADEPTGNLDSVSGRELMQMFKDYNSKGNTIIMVTHDLIFLTHATRSINMSDGLIVGEYLEGDKGLEKFKVGNKR
ncbi:MAG: ABC transporter ATP-binding protein [Candidatus Dojkabacteria bacterium]|jgi:putative ABC transport system ATP-binding protein|nr:ABC transporter ATP-binding protein [Candidatus Dojkabacteria bacterium]